MAPTPVMLTVYFVHIFGFLRLPVIIGVHVTFVQRRARIYHQLDHVTTVLAVFIKSDSTDQYTHIYQSFV
jgi:hypothetical protein